MSALKLEKLVKIYDNSFHALKSVDLKIEKGDFFGLLGPNGAGKSTILNIISSLVKKTSGKVWIENYDIDTHLSKAKTALGIVPQEVNLAYFEKVIDILVCQAGFYGVPRKKALSNAEKYLNLLNLWDKRNEITRNLSGGMKRRVMIARALMHEPNILILDEPTAGIDIDNRHSMWQFLRELNKTGTTILLTSHYLEEISNLCNNIAILSQGQIVEQGSLKAILKKLEEEIFVLDVQEPHGNLNFNNDQITIIDPCTIEITVRQNLGEIIDNLTKQGIKVKSIHSKLNRLEKFFLQVTKR